MRKDSVRVAKYKVRHPELLLSSFMRLTIFWRVLLAQSALIALALAVSFYALTKLHLLTQISTEILTVDLACVNDEKRLLKAFFAEMRNAEKFLLMRDQVFHEAFNKGSMDFNDALTKVSALINTERESQLLKEIRILHGIYGRNLSLSDGDENSSSQNKTKISENLIEKVNELIRIREEAASSRTAKARDQASSAAKGMAWLTFFGIAGALILAYLHGRSLSNPLKKLAHEMGHVGRGEFSRSIDIKGPEEVQRLAQAFNCMAEELAHLDRLKADFTAHVSHELRTPLTAIREGTALLLEEIPGPITRAQQEILGVVQNHSERLFRSISSILDLSKMEAEMMEYEFTACDLNALIRKSAQAVELIARKREIRLFIETVDPLPMVSIDERRIGQVLDNLLSNALKFTPEGGQIHISASVKSAKDGRNKDVEVVISDNGPGIPKEEIHNIFKQFYQCVQNRTKGQHGTGLGLAIARHIIEAHRGRIWAESELGSGSTFHFTLPVSSSAEKPAKGLSST